MPKGIYLSNKKRFVSAVARAKISAFQRGRVVSLETRARMSIAQKGHKVSEETRAKIGAIHKGRIFSEERRKRMSETAKRLGTRPPSALGRKTSPETIEKLRKINLGSKRGSEARQKMSEWQRGEKNNNWGKEFSFEHRKKIGLAHTGEKSALWRGGKTSKNRTIRNSMEYKDWRKKVFERDNYTCVLCKAKNGEGKAVVLNADHIKQFAYHPELRSDIANGRTLCVGCHRKTDTFKKKIKC